MSTNAQDVDAANPPRVEVSKLKDGQRTWKVVAVAEDASADALRSAAALASELDRELADPESDLHKPG